MGSDAPPEGSLRIPPHVGVGEGCFWGVVGVLWAFATFAALKTTDAAPVVVTLGVLSLAPLALGIKVRRTRLRYAGASFEMTAPARLGEPLEGVLHLPHTVGEDARVRANLTCQRTVSADSPDPVLGRSYAYGSPRPPLESAASHFPVRVDVPTSGLASGHNGSYWTLQFTSEAGFSGLDVAFRVTVGEPAHDS